MKHGLQPVLLLQLLRCDEDRSTLLSDLFSLYTTRGSLWVGVVAWMLWWDRKHVSRSLEDDKFAHGNLADFHDEQTANASLIALNGAPTTVFLR